MGMQHYLTTIATIIRHELTRFLRVWIQTILPPIITQLLYFIIFGKFIGSQISPIHNIPYMSYIVPGLVMMAIIMTAYNASAFGFFIMKFNRSIEDLIIAPVPDAIILLGFTIAGVLRGLLVGALVLLLSLCFTTFTPQHLGIILLTATLAATLFALAGLVNGMYAKQFDSIAIVPTFILTPLIYLGGVFYAIKQLPPFWQKLSMINPIAYIIELFRYGFLGIQHFPLLNSFAVMMLCILGLFLYAHHTLKRGILRL
jgi:ABC-2 type transport system permease protein